LNTTVNEGGPRPLRWGMPSLLELPGAEANAQACRELGLQFVELNMNCPQYLPDALPAEQVRALTARLGVAFTLHLPEETDLAAFPREVRQGHVACVTHAIEWAAAAGIGKLTLHLRRGVHFSLPDRKVLLYQVHQDLFLRNLADSAGLLADLCRPRGAHLLIENTGQGDLPFLRQAIHELLARFAGPLGLTWDVGHDDAAGHLTPLDLARQRGWSVVIEVKTRAALEASIAALREKGLL
jgi:hypothetical protein